MDKVREIDLEKRKIEIKYVPILRYTFRHMAADAKALYIATKAVPAKSLADNYRPEFLKIIRDAQRETIKKFGFDMRMLGEEKGYDFRTAKYKALIEYQIETKDTGAILNVTQAEKINNTFAMEAALFVANTSEEQADYITETNEKEISDAEKLAVILFFQDQEKLVNKLDKLRNEKAKIEFEEMLGGSQSVAAAKKRKIQEEIVKTEEELKEFNKNKDKFIGESIEEKIIEKGEWRSELISSQNVGMAEAWSRNKEAQLIVDNVEGASKDEIWRAILDSHTRPDHVIADGQKKQNGFYVVGGHQCKYPRDPVLPIDQTAWCRCEEEIKINFPEI